MMFNPTLSEVVYLEEKAGELRLLLKKSGYEFRRVSPPVSLLPCWSVLLNGEKITTLYYHALRGWDIEPQHFRFRMDLAEACQSIGELCPYPTLEYDEDGDIAF